MSVRFRGLLLPALLILACSGVRSAETEDNPALAGFGELKDLLSVLKAGDTASHEKIPLRPVHFAAFRGEVERALQLLDARDLKQRVPESQFSPMHAASLGGSLPCVEALLKQNVPVHVATPMGWTPLHIACFRGDVAMLKVLIANGAECDFKQEAGFSPLHVAAARRNAECVREMLKTKVDVNAVSKEGLTAMHLASPDIEIMQMLIDRKATINCQDIKQLTPAFSAVTSGNIDALKFLQKNGATLQPEFVHAAVKAEQKPMFDYLLAQRVELEMPYGWDLKITPLHIASVKKDAYYARKLLERGVKIGPPLVNGDTPLHLATGEGTLDMVNLLLEKGASVTFFNKEQETPLFPAAKLNRRDIIDALAKKGADLYWKRSDGATIVEVAEKSGHGELAAYLRNLRAKQ